MAKQGWQSATIHADVYHAVWKAICLDYIEGSPSDKPKSVSAFIEEAVKEKLEREAKKK